MDNSNSQMFASGYFSHSQIIKITRILFASLRALISSPELCLWNLNSTSNTPVTPHRLSCQISANPHKAETSANVHKHWNETCAKGNDIISHVISANQHFALTFSKHIFNSRDIVASSPSFPPPPTPQPPLPECPGGLARRLIVNILRESGVSFLTLNKYKWLQWYESNISWTTKAYRCQDIKIRCSKIKCWNNVKQKNSSLKLNYFDYHLTVNNKVEVMTWNAT